MTPEREKEINALAGTAALGRYATELFSALERMLEETGAHAGWPGTIVFRTAERALALAEGKPDPLETGDWLYRRTGHRP